MSEGRWCYVGIEPCGCITAMAIDEVEHRQLGKYTVSLADAHKFVGESIAEFEASGRTVERRWVPKGTTPLISPKDCPHTPQQLKLMCL